jgi:hypothetical protein
LAASSGWAGLKVSRPSSSRSSTMQRKNALAGARVCPTTGCKSLSNQASPASMR